MHESFKLIYEQIVLNKHLKSKDRKVVKEVYNDMDLNSYSSLAALNEIERDQLRMEARCAYLVSVYTDHAESQESDSDYIEANAQLSLPEKGPDGKKYLAADRDALLTTNDMVTEARQAKREAKALLRDISKMSKMVDNRNQKIENLQVNHRREMAQDSQQR